VTDLRSAMPTYVILSPDGESVLSGTSGVVSLESFTQFLETGIERFEENQQAAVELRLSKKDAESQR